MEIRMMEDRPHGGGEGCIDRGDELVLTGVFGGDNKRADGLLE